MHNTQKKNYITLTKDRNGEYPITRFWYTKQAGRTIEEIIDRDPSFMEWAISTFQNVTPSQAAYFEKKTHKSIPLECIQDVRPYEWQDGDSEEMYMDLCRTLNLDKTILKYRGVQLNLF